MVMGQSSTHFESPQHIGAHDFLRTPRVMPEKMPCVSEIALNMGVDAQQSTATF